MACLRSSSRLGDRLGHAVDGPAEHAHFARRPDAHPRREVAADHLLGHLHDGANGPQNPFVHQEEQHQAGQRRAAHDRQEYGADDHELMDEGSLQKPDGKTPMIRPVGSRIGS